MKAYNNFLNMLQTLPSPKHFTDQPQGAEMAAKSPFIIVKGMQPCLTRGFDKLRGKKGVEVKTVRTLAGEVMERKMKIVFVQQYDPVDRIYEDFGEFWADIDTGTLYRPFDGVCMSSTMIWMELE
jgi:hypothetical protein